MIRVVIADDHPIVLAGMQQLLERCPGIEVTGTATSSTELMKLLDDGLCDVLITDYSMPRGIYGDGIKMLLSIYSRHPDLPIVMFTMLDNARLLNIIRSIGVLGVLNKSDPIELLIPAVRAASVGNQYFSPKVLEALLHTPQTAQWLSRREMEVVRLCAAGMTITEIARLCHRSSKTISAQKSTAMRKLGLKNDFELYQYATQHGLRNSEL
ncbi:response regulator [Pseudomonas nicosulfuronedens]